MKNYRYDEPKAVMIYRVSTYPPKTMKTLGFKVIKSESCAIANCWFFRVENEISDIPSYITLLPDNFEFADERDKHYFNNVKKEQII